MSPVCRASNPRTNCSQRGSERMMPNSPSETSIAAMFPFRKVPMRKRLNESSETRPVRSRWMPHAMKATAPRIAMRNATGTGESAHGQVQDPIVKSPSVAHHPRVRPSMRPKTSAPNVMNESAPPMMSIERVFSSRDSATVSSTPMMMRMPSGMLIPNAHRHENAVVSHPPSSGPTAAMPPIVEPQTANAIPRSRPRKVALISDRVVGRIIAPPMPWISRARISRSPVGAKAAAMDESTKITTPSSMMRRRPKRSASDPNTSRSDAKTSV